MAASPQLPEEQYYVVVNSEEQYSIWPEGQPLPVGWQTVGKTGIKSDCLNYIEQVWTDMRPRSLREQMALAINMPVAEQFDISAAPAKQSLVDRLSQGQHPLKIIGLKTLDLSGLSQQIKMGLIKVVFTETQGGTELCLRVVTNANAADSVQGGQYPLSGELNLDGINVRCVANIDIATLQGYGRLELAHIN